MKDFPIIFSGPMVSALLAGRKTMTRRLVTSPLRKVLPGDRLWVRESFADQHPLAVQVGRYSQEGRAGIPGPPPVNYREIYKADGEPLQIWRNGTSQHPYFTLDGPADDVAAKHPCVCSNYSRDGKAIYWTPSIHMTRWQSRLTLAVIAIKTESLQDITEADAVAEGIAYHDHGLNRYGQKAECWHHDPEQAAMGSNFCLGSARHAFGNLWNSLHGENAWAENPALVAISFDVIKANIDAPAEEATA